MSEEIEIEIETSEKVEKVDVTKIKTPLKAIRAKCLECSNYSPVEVVECKIHDCALYSFRRGSNPRAKGKTTGRTLSPETIAKGQAGLKAWRDRKAIENAQAK